MSCYFLIWNFMSKIMLASCKPFWVLVVGMILITRWIHSGEKKRPFCAFDMIFGNFTQKRAYFSGRIYFNKLDVAAAAASAKCCCWSICCFLLTKAQLQSNNGRKYFIWKNNNNKWINEGKSDEREKEKESIHIKKCASLNHMKHFRVNWTQLKLHTKMQYSIECACGCKESPFKVYEQWFETITYVLLEPEQNVFATSIQL